MFATDPTPTPQPPRPRVLIADDDQFACDSAREMLDFCDTRVVKDGDAALKSLAGWRPDLILSDVRMPKVDGLELCRAVRADPLTAAIPIVLLTGMTDRRSIVQGWEAGADEYLLKPLIREEVVPRVRAMLVNAHNRRSAEEAESLRRRERMQHDFLANVSHEFRTPVAAIKGFAETLLNGGLEDEKNREEFVQIIDRHADRLSRLIDNLLKISVRESGKRNRLPEPIDLSAYVNRLVASIAPLAAARGVSMESAIEPGLSILMDEGELAHMLFNLCENAIKFSRPGGKVLISSRREGPRLILEVADTGLGIHEDVLPHIFERFHVNRQSVPTELRGSGLGLSIVKSIVEGNGGEVLVTSSPKGSTFTVSLPLAEA